MRHDVLCAKYGFEDDPGQDVWGYEPPVRACDCARFPGVRKDERLRVRGLIQAETDSICSRRPTPDAAALDGLMTAQVELDCPGCGLGIHVGDPIQLGERGWLHPVCALAEDVDAERRHDMRREG